MNNVNKKVAFFVHHNNGFEKVEQELVEASTCDGQDNTHPENYYG